MDIKRISYHLTGTLGGIMMTSLPTYIAFRDGGLVDMLMHDETPLPIKIVTGVSLTLGYAVMIAGGTMFSLASYSKGERIFKILNNNQ